MVQEGPINVSFAAQTHSVEVTLDPQTQEQLLSFRVAVTVSLQQLIKQLIEPAAPVPHASSSPSSKLVAPCNVAGAPFLQPLQHPSGQGFPGVARPMPPVSAGPIMDEQEQQQRASLGKQLMASLQRHDMAMVRSLVQNGADVNFQEGAPYFRSPLHIAVENGAMPEEICYLLKARANVNAVMMQNKTPMHLALQQYRKISTFAINMLLSSKADSRMTDCSGISPVDLIKQCAQEWARGDGAESGPKARQLMSMVCDQPCVSFHVEGQEIVEVHWADVKKERIVYCTKLGVGMYSMKSASVELWWEGPEHDLMVENVSVNPECGTVAVCFAGMHSGTTMMLFWPNGNIEYEEPVMLKMNTAMNTWNDREQSPPTVSLSRTEGTLVAFGRLLDGKVICWTWTLTRAQIVAEKELVKCGGIFAHSDEGNCLCAFNRETNDIEVWASPAIRQNQDFILCSRLRKRPSAMSVQSCHDAYSPQPTAILAIFEEAMQTNLAIDVFRVDLGSGEHQHVNRLPINAPSFSLRFCHRSADHLFCGCSNGTWMLCDLQSCEVTYGHETPNTRSIAASFDRSLIVTAESTHFTVSQVPEPAH